MFDIRTLLIVTAVTDILLAAALWLGLGRRLKEGLAQWTLSLVAHAVGYALFAGRGNLPDWHTIVAANALVALSFSLAMAALCAFRGRAVPHGVHLAMAALGALLAGAFLEDYATRVVATSLFFAACQAGLAALAWRRMDDVNDATHHLIVGTFLIGAATFLGRAVPAAIAPDAMDDFFTASVFQITVRLLAYAVVFTSSIAFLLMHKERADHLLQQLASLDPLTHAFNRRTFVDLARKQLSRARRLDAPLSLVLLDVDHFKQVNDTHGHLVGDRVLQRFAEVVRGELRNEDVLVRYGGEEFCLLLPDVAGTGAVALAGRVRKAVAREPFAIDGLEIPVTLSAGVAARIDEGPEGLDALLARADEALYVAKSRGRNRVAAISLGRSRAA